MLIDDNPVASMPDADPKPMYTCAHCGYPYHYPDYHSEISANKGYCQHCIEDKSIDTDALLTYYDEEFSAENAVILSYLLNTSVEFDEELAKLIVRKLRRLEPDEFAVKLLEYTRDKGREAYTKWLMATY